MIRKNKHPREHGQIIIILALSLVGLACITALAVDLGQVFNDRRYDQNVADSASLAGGQAAIENFKLLKPSEFHCNTGGAFVSSLSDPAWIEKPAWIPNDAKLNIIFNAAISTAAVNRKTDLVPGLDGSNGVAMACGTDSHGPYLDIKVMVSNTSSTSFVQFFNGGPVNNTVEAITRSYPKTPYANGYALYALDSLCNEGILIDGGGNQDVNVRITDGGAFSHSCINSTGHGSMTADTVISCYNDPDHPNWCDPNDTNFTPRLTTVDVDPLADILPLPIPDCAALFANGEIADQSDSTDTTLFPGYYSGGFPGHQNLELLPGLYCIQGNVKINGGGSITSIPDANGIEGVTLVFMDGGFSSTGTGYMDITAPIPGEPYIAPAVPGIAIAFADGNSSSLDMGGNSLSTITGTVYAPESEITLGGTGDVPQSTQFIGLMFKYHGTEMEQLYYNGDKLFQWPANLQLYK